MNLLTKAIAKQLHEADLIVIASGECPDKIAVKYFTPWTSGTWHITSGTPLDADGHPVTDPDSATDWHLYGHCDLGNSRDAELGFVLLSELKAITGPGGLKIERDLNYSGTIVDGVPVAGN